MDGSHFDSLTRSLASTGSRRRALGAVIVATLSLLSVQTEPTPAKKKPCLPCKKRKKGKCKGKLPNGTPCGNGTCQDGRCVPPQTASCPNGQRLCRGTCLSVLICCDERDCAGGRTCQQGTCACPSAKPKTCPGSTVCAACCTDAECQPSGGEQEVCRNGECVCSLDGLRRCPAGTTWAGWCASCCQNSECPSGKVCVTHIGEPPHCECEHSECDGVCVGADCAGLCFEQCPNGTAIGQPCCSGLTCREEAPGDTKGSCQP